MGDRYDLRNVGSHNAVGPGATSVNVGDSGSDDSQRILAALEGLRTALSLHAGEIGDVDTASKAVSDATDDVSHGRFDLLLPLMRRVSAAAPGVAAVTSAVIDVTRLLH
jgi:hypothetical protein